MDNGRDVGRHKQAAVRYSCERFDGALDIGSVANGTVHNLDREWLSNFFCSAQEVIIGAKRIC